MPLVSASDYSMPFPFSNGHVQTMFPPLFRKVVPIPAHRVRIDTPDGDFLDLDFLFAEEADALHDGAPKKRPLAIISHGLEGNSRRKYVLGMAHSLMRQGYDVCAWNFRGCSGEPNRTMRLYHSGEIGDLHTVITHCALLGYQRIVLAGFSMGGNQILTYLGTNPAAVHPAVVAAVTFSVPCDLVGAAVVLDKPANGIYMRYFMRTLREKIREKHQRYPQLNIDGLDTIRSFEEFDTRFTAPLYGFRDARDYWQRSGCGQFLSRIRVPALLVNAKNDPFLSPSCFPVAVAERSDALFLEMPSTGGHVGFVRRAADGLYWSDLRAAAFLASVL